MADTLEPGPGSPPARRSLFSTALSVLTTQASIIPIALATQVLLARFLSVEGRGQYAIAVEFAALAIAAFQLGWPQASIFRLRNAQTPASIVNGAALWMTLGVSAVAIGLCLAFKEPIRTRFMTDAPDEIFYLALLLFPVQLFGVVFAAVARGLDRFDLFNAYRFAMAAVVLLGLGVALLLFEPTASVALQSFLGVSVLISIALGIAVMAPTGVTLRVPSREFLQTLRFGAKSHLQILLANLHQRADIFLLAWLVGDAAQVAIYTIAVSVVNRIRLVPSSIAVTLFPTASGLGESEAGALTARVLRHANLWVGLSVVAIAPLSYFLVPVLFGTQYEASVLPLLVLLPATGFLTIQMVLGRYFLSQDRQWTNTACYAFGVAVNLGANFWLIPRYGVLGAATASLVSYCAQACLILGVFVFLSKQSLGECLVVGRQDFEIYRRRLARVRARLRA